MLTSDTILHIALPDDWREAIQAGEYVVSTRGRTLDDVGFVHCSFPDQVAGVANFAYTDLVELVLLRVDPERLGGVEIRIEPGGDNDARLFPHIYGPIPTSAVVETLPWRRAEGDRWSVATVGA